MGLKEGYMRVVARRASGLKGCFGLKAVLGLGGRGKNEQDSAVKRHP